MFRPDALALAWQRLEQFRFHQRKRRVTRNLRGTRRMPRGEKRRSGRQRIQRRYLR